MARRRARGTGWNDPRAVFYRQAMREAAAEFRAWDRRRKLRNLADKLRRHQMLGKSLPERRPPKMCGDCESREWNSTGYCEKHYFRRYRARRREPKERRWVRCWCGELAIAHGECNKHYQRTLRRRKKLSASEVLAESAA